MPPVAAAVAGAVLGVATAFANVLVAIGLSTGAAAFIAGNLLRLGAALAVGYVMRALSPKPGVNAIDQGRELAVKFDAAYPREVAVGKTATGGSLVYATCTGTNNEYLWRVFALSDCEIESVEEIWGDGVKLTFSGDWHAGWVNCTSHFKSAGGAARLWARVYKGTDTDPADSDLDAASSEWTSNCKGKGVAKIYLKFQYDVDAFPGGQEPSIFCVLKGAKIPDPRTGTTVWTRNATLIAAKAMKGFEMNGVRVVGLGASDEDLPQADIEDAADICDEDVTLAAGGTEKRYSADGMLSGAETGREIITNLTAAMAGRHIDRGGEIIFKPGVARTPVLHITDADILADAPIVYAQKRTANALINTMVSSFVDPASSWLEKPLPVRKDSAAITADGDRFVARRAYRFVTSKTQGERIDEIALREARLQARASFSLPLWALELEPGDWFTWTSARFGNVSKTFMVEGMQLGISSDPENPSARVQIAAAEIASTVFDWTTGDEITNATATVARSTPAVTLIGVPAGVAYQVPMQRTVTGTLLTSSDVGSTATITVAAHTDTGAGGSVARNAGNITGLSFGTGYHVWAQDPGTPYGAGGSVTYVAATSLATHVGDNDKKYIGYITTVNDGGGGGSFTPPGGDDCVAADAWLDHLRQARDIGPGDIIDVLDWLGTGKALAEVEGSRIVRAEAVRLVSSSGIALTCSMSTPITQPDGSVVLAGQALGVQVAVDDAEGVRWERVVMAEPVGEVEVARIHVHGLTYAAGDAPGRRMFTHNPLKP